MASRSNARQLIKILIKIFFDRVSFRAAVWISAKLAAKAGRVDFSRRVGDMEIFQRARDVLVTPEVKKGTEGGNTRTEISRDIFRFSRIAYFQKRERPYGERAVCLSYS